MNLATFLMGMAGPLAMRVLMTIGFTAISFTGVQAVFDGLVTAAQGYWSSLPVAVLQLGSIMGIPEGFGIILGAYAARLALWLATSQTRLIFTGRA